MSTPPKSRFSIALLTATLASVSLNLPTVCQARTALATSCPKSEQEDQLTIAQVMRNFGRFMLPADTTLQKGLFAPASVMDSEFKSAIAALGIALDCAETVVHDKTGKLVPEKTHRLPPAEQASYLKLFYDDLLAFEDSLRAYQAEFQSLHIQDPMARDFKAALTLRDRTRELARKAHEDLK